MYEKELIENLENVVKELNSEYKSKFSWIKNAILNPNISLEYKKTSWGELEIKITCNSGELLKRRSFPLAKIYITANCLYLKNEGERKFPEFIEKYQIKVNKIEETVTSFVKKYNLRFLIF